MQGICHECREMREVSYCRVCDHWFCAHCARKYPQRLKSAFIEQLIGRRAGCCGPPLGREGHA